MNITGTRRSLTLSLILGLTAAPELRAATYYVAKTGSDSASGSLSAPFLTVRKGVSALRAGDTLQIRAGTYAEGISSIASGSSWGTPVTVAAYPGERVVLAPASGSRVIDLGGPSYVVFDGLVLDGRGVGYDGVKIVSPSHHIRIRNSEVLNAPFMGILVGRNSNYHEFIGVKMHDNGGRDIDHGIYINSSYNLVERCDVYRNAGNGIQIYNGYAGESANNNVIRYNKVHDNAALGSKGNGINLTSGSGNLAHDNIIWNNKGGIQVQYGGINAKIFNNTIYNNPTYGIYLGNQSGANQGGAAAGAVVRNNIVYQAGITSVMSGAVVTNNVTVDPKFVSAAGADFHLASGSPAINKGYNLSGEGLGADFAGTVRPVGAAYDAGAFEYTGTSAGTGDATAPTISAVSASNVTSAGASVSWTTSEPADGQVEYGPSTAYGASSALQSALSTSHSVALSGLTAGTLYHYRVKSKDAAGNTRVSSDATFTTAAGASAPGCVSAAAGTWKNVSLPAQTGAFTATFDATPSMSSMDGVVGLSNGPASAYSAVAAAVRFNTSGKIDARSGGVYAAAGSIPYSAGLVYKFRLVVDLASRKYSAYVRQGTGSELLIGSAYSFRTEQAGVTRLDNLALAAGTGGVTVCGPAVTASAGTADTTAPTISAVTAGGLTAGGAAVTWTTNEPADGQVEYGPTTAYGLSTPPQTAMTTSHSVSLSGLTAGTLYHYRVKSKDAAGNLRTSADATFTTAAAAPAAGCVTSAGTWVNQALRPLSGTSTVEFDATPSAANIDGVAGLSNGPASAYTALAAAVRFNNTGRIDARNDGAFAAAASIPYSAGLTYHFRLAVSLTARKYSAYVRQGAGAEQLIGANYSFRNEQLNATALNNLGVYATGGAESVCGAVVK